MSCCPPGSVAQRRSSCQNIALFGGYAFLAGLLLALPVGFLLLCLNIVVGMLSRARARAQPVRGRPARQPRGRRGRALLVGLPAMGDYMLVIVREALDAAQNLVLG